jgi:hypothetical protein
VTSMLTIGTARVEDIDTLARKMRKADRREASRAFPHATPAEAVELSSSLSKILLSARTRKDKPVALAGVAGPLGGGEGAAWMITTNWVYKHPVPFLRRSGEVLSEMFKRSGCHTFTNLVDCQNTLHIRWLTWMGAEWDNPMMLHGFPFQRFYLRQERLRHVHRDS